MPAPRRSLTASARAARTAGFEGFSPFGGLTGSAASKGRANGPAGTGADALIFVGSLTVNARETKRRNSTAPRDFGSSRPSHAASTGQACDTSTGPLEPTSTGDSP